MAFSTSRRDRLDISAIPLLYTPVARAALANYIGFTDPAPHELTHVNPADNVDPEEWDQHALGIAPLASETGHDAVVLENVVARICLEPVQHTLPQWISVSSTGGRR